MGGSRGGRIGGRGDRDIGRRLPRRGWGVYDGQSNNHGWREFECWWPKLVSWKEMHFD